MIRAFYWRILFALLLCTASCHCLGQESRAPAVSFCELVNNPQQYNMKEVNVRATYKYGFEWSYLYCLSCLDKGTVWLEFPFDLDDSAIKALKRGPKGAGTVNVTVQGTFIKCGSCGHLSGYPFNFLANKASSVATVVKGMKSLPEEQKAEKQWACGGSNPK